MVQFSNSEKTDMILLLGQCRGNAREAARLYQRRFPNRDKFPVKSTFQAIEQNLRSDGSFNRHQKQPKVNRIVGNDERGADMILASFHINPHTSSRAVGKEFGVSHTTVLRVLKTQKFHPYHIHLQQALSDEDRLRRTEFCLALRWQVEDNPNFVSKVLWSDEATFHRDGTVNRHNMHYWSQQNPYWLRENYHQQRFKTNVWVGIFGGRIIGPFFFEENLTGAIYLEFLQTSVTDALRDLPPAETQDMWFQQDGAPPHFHRGVREWLTENFPNRWIGRGGPLPWPPRSPDLTPLDFFFWGYVKSAVYETEVHTLEELQQRIRSAVEVITPAVLANALRSIISRGEECLGMDGGHIEHMR